MTMRKPTYAQQIAELKNEIHNIELFMAKAVKEAEELDAISKQRLLTKEERQRVNELIDYIHEKNVFLVKAKKQVRSFYAPVPA